MKRFSDHEYLAYHQPPSLRLAGVINPRRLIKAQHTIAGSKFGCHLMDGQVEKVTRLGIDKNFILELTGGGLQSQQEDQQEISQKHPVSSINTKLSSQF